MLKRLLLVLFFAVSATLFSAQEAFAHTTNVFAHAHGNEIHGEAILGGDTPMIGAKITAYDPSGKILAETVTDEKGEFSLTVTQRCDWKIVASGEGHQATCVVPMDELPSGLPNVASAAHSHPHDDGHTHDDGHSHGDELGGPAGEDEELHRQIIALRRDIEKLRDKLRWQDIIGGVGYILGIMGIVFYFLGSRQGERFPSKSND